MRAGVLLPVHVERRELRVAQVALLIGVVDPLRERLGVAAAGPDVLALVADHDRRARVLTAGQHATRGDVRVHQQLERDEAVVGRRLRVVEDLAQLREVPGAQQVGDVVEGRRRELHESLGLDPQDLAPARANHPDEVPAELAVGGGVLAELEELLEAEFGHASSLQVRDGHTRRRSRMNVAAARAAEGTPLRALERAARIRGVELRPHALNRGFRWEPRHPPFRRVSAAAGPRLR